MISDTQSELPPVVTKESIFFVGMAILAGVILTVLQDYMVTIRHNTSFVFYESLLFKCVWPVFILFFCCVNKVFHRLQSESYHRLFLIYAILVISHILVTTAMVWSIAGVFKEQGYGFIKIVTFTLSNDSAKILLVYFFSLIYFRHFRCCSASKVQNNAVKLTSSTEPQSLLIKNGKRNHLVMFDDILCIKADSPYVIIQTEELQYLHSSTLKAVSTGLGSRFLQLHRSCIVNIDKVLFYHSRLNGDYDVTLCGGTQVRLSRNYAKKFKSVMENLDNTRV